MESSSNKSASFSPIAVSVEDLLRLPAEAHLNLHLKLSENNFALLQKREQPIDKDRLRLYQSKGVQQLYIEATDQEALRSWLTPSSVMPSLSGESQGQDTVSDVKKAALLLQQADQHLAQFFAQIQDLSIVDEKTTEATQKLVKSFVATMTDHPRTLTIMLKVASHGDYLYYHSLSVSVISLYLARVTDNCTPKLLEVVGMGGLLHDIGYTQISREILDSPAPLTPAQWREMRQHPSYAVKMLEGLSHIPDEVRFVLGQHHEEPRGTGYPGGLKGPVIFYPAKIVALADAFCALTSKRPYRPAQTVEQALSILRHETGKWDSTLIEKMLSLFHYRSTPSGQVKPAA